MTTSLQIIVERAIVSTITLPVADEKPPGYAPSASHALLPANGSARTKVSAGTEARENCSSPVAAMGSTKMLIIAKYAGKIHRAARRSERTVFSTTVTWNCLGKQMIAAAASNVCDTNPIRQEASLTALDIWGNASACS